MKKIRAAVIDYSNIGAYSVRTLEAAEDFEVAGIVRRQGGKDKPLEPTPCEVADDITKLKGVDMAILAVPTRNCSEYAEKISALGTNIVDSSNIHNSILDYHTKRMENNKHTDTASVTSTSRDPGSDFIVHILLESPVPESLSYANSGPSRSMGHSVVARNKKGAKEALSIAILLGEGIRRRIVHVELKEGAKLEDITRGPKADNYFAHDELHVSAVPSVAALDDVGHGVHTTHRGVSGKARSQYFSFNMSINNPTFIAQVLVDVARTSMRLAPGCYTMPGIPVIDMLPGNREDIITTLV